jgi:carbon monoxide dehydrogenase subunit G
MEILGQQIIAASRQKVWDALNDPDVLKACLPGCELVERISPEEFRVIIKTAIGPPKARFQGSLKITEALPPASCVMQFEGQGGAVGFGKGTSTVVLKEMPEGTELSYEAKAQIGGKLAQVGSRLIDSVAKKMADDFFKAFQNELSPEVYVKPSTDTPKPTTQMALSNSVPDGMPSNSMAVQPHHTSDVPRPALVPAWWLFPAALLGAALMLAGSRWMH